MSMREGPSQRADDALFTTLYSFSFLKPDSIKIFIFSKTYSSISVLRICGGVNFNDLFLLWQISALSCRIVSLSLTIFQFVPMSHHLLHHQHWISVTQTREKGREHLGKDPKKTLIKLVVPHRAPISQIYLWIGRRQCYQRTPTSSCQIQSFSFGHSQPIARSFFACSKIWWSR